MYKIVLLVLLAIVANAGGLTLKQGQINAHTEVFGDNTINPSSSKITSFLDMKNGVESIRGQISFLALSLVSDNLDRDEHMYEAIRAKTEKFITVEIKDVVKEGKNYDVMATLTLNGVSKDIKAASLITQENGTLNISGGFKINMSDYGIEPPSMFFLTVRDQVDVTYDLNYEEK